MIKTLRRAAVLAGLALGLTACIPEFANPLVGGVTADPAIIGSWTGKAGDDDKPAPLDIKADGDGVVVVMKEMDAAVSADNTLTFKGTTAEVGGVHYINLKLVEGPDVPPDIGQMIFRYEVKDGQIQVWDLDETKIKEAIDSGALKGTTSGSGSDTSPKVSASSEELAAFFATPAGQAAFKSGTGDVLILTRATP